MQTVSEFTRCTDDSPQSRHLLVTQGLLPLLRVCELSSAASSAQSGQKSQRGCYTPLNVTGALHAAVLCVPVMF